MKNLYKIEVLSNLISETNWVWNGRNSDELHGQNKEKVLVRKGTKIVVNGIDVSFLEGEKGFKTSYLDRDKDYRKIILSKHSFGCFENREEDFLAEKIFLEEELECEVFFCLIDKDGKRTFTTEETLRVKAPVNDLSSPYIEKDENIYETDIEYFNSLLDEVFQEKQIIPFI